MKASWVLWQLFLAFGGAVGFALFFHVPLKRIPVTGIGGILCWGIYLLCRNVFALGILPASFFSSAATFWYAEVMARILKLPAIIIFNPSSVPLIPGSGLYYTMSYAVRRDWPNVVASGWETAQCALGIALGMSIICAVYDAGRMVHISFSRKK